MNKDVFITKCSLGRKRAKTSKRPEHLEWCRLVLETETHTYLLLLLSIIIDKMLQFLIVRNKWHWKTVSSTRDNEGGNQKDTGSYVKVAKSLFSFDSWTQVVHHILNWTVHILEFKFRYSSPGLQQVLGYSIQCLLTGIICSRLGLATSVHLFFQW